jgi:DNA polymerase elongation subunit (family B)
VLGLPSFRFYDVDNAEAVTITGKTVIQTTEKIANQYYTNLIGEIYDITLENGNTIQMGGNTMVKLANGLTKKVSELTENDDVLI